MGEACLIVDSPMRIPATQGSALSWYAVQTHYRCEGRAARDLASKGFEIYLPLLREVHQWKDRRKLIETPAFSGYLFVRYETCLQNRIRVLETSGVVRVLGSNHIPSRVPDTEVESLRRTLNSGLHCDRCDSLLPGDLVRVVKGPLSGIQGKVVRIKNSLRLVVAVSVISQAVSAELGWNDVEAVQNVQ